MAQAVGAIARVSTWPCRPAPAPASRWPTSCRRSSTPWSAATVVVSTATIALQRQLVDRDLPRLARRSKPLLGPARRSRSSRAAATTCACNSSHGGDAGRPDGRAVRPVRRSQRWAATVKRLHEWADDTETGDRDELVPGVPSRAWRQVSVSARECLGAASCPVGDDCFAEQARGRGRPGRHRRHQPRAAGDRRARGPRGAARHDVVVVDEAHELVDRVTGVATDELTAAAVSAAAAALRQARRPGARRPAGEAGEGLGARARGPAPGRWSAARSGSGALSAGRDAARRARSARPRAARGPDGDGAPARSRRRRSTRWPTPPTA